MEDKKIKIPQWVFNLFITISLFSMGFMFNTVVQSVAAVESRANVRIDKLESKIAEINPLFMEIKERLAGIEATLAVKLGSSFK